MPHPRHVLDYGDPGSGKSTFAATAPTPALIQCFDPLSKAGPYLKTKKGKVTDLQQHEDGFMFQDVISSKGKLLRRVEYHSDPNPKDPIAYLRYLGRMADFEGEAKEWASLVLDSLVFFELSARKCFQYKLNPTAKDARQWYASSTEACEELLLMRFGSLPINVVVLTHVDDSRSDINGAVIRCPNAPGRLRKHLAAAYGEIYHQYVTRTDTGEIAYSLQTRSDDQWMASSLIGVPDPCYPHWKELVAEEAE